MATHGVNDAEMGGLTAEERAGLEDESAADAEVKAIEAALAAGDDDDDDETPPAQPTAAAETPPADGAPAATPEEAAAATAAAAAAAGAETPPSDDEIVDRIQIPPTPRLAAPDISTYDSDRAKLLDERKTLRAKFRDGDLGADEFEAQLDAVTDQLGALDAKKARAEVVQEQNEASYRASIMGVLMAFKEEVRAEHGIDYDTNPTLATLWDAKVKALAQDKAHADRSYEWFLRKGHQLALREMADVAAALGLAPPKKDPKPAAKPAPVDAAAKRAAAVQAAVAGRQPPTTKVKSLATLPAAGTDDVRTGTDAQWAALDKLQGMALESALAKLPKEQADAYLMRA